ncbi:hypothetical protein CVD08_00555 [Acinetobacter seifertii]|nr:MULTISPECIES: hypothetical protein [Acinetobacter]PJF04445.1 hypothetical protein CVD06_06745 [Acinetobacter seifertii]PJG72203.1 hypothetical protein CVD08_00555 [Acinetobacter seifertii]
MLFSLFKSTIKLGFKTKKNSNQTQAIKSFSFFKCSEFLTILKYK